MDANELRFWMLARERDWVTGPDADYDPARRRLRLRSGRDRALPAGANGVGAEAEARAALERTPQTRDAYGTRAYWDDDLRVIAAEGLVARDGPARAGGFAGAHSPVRLLSTPDDARPSDIAAGHDGILYVAVGGVIVLHDLRGRWADVVLEAPDFDAWRLAPDPAGGVWVLGRTAQRLAHAHGEPLPARPYSREPRCTVRPCIDDPDPPTIAVLPGAWWTGEAVALACAPDGRLAVLAWQPSDDARLFIQREHGGLSLVAALRGVRFPFSFSWLSETAVAVRITRVPAEALVFELADVIDGEGRGEGGGGGEGTERTDPREVGASGEIHPLRDAPVEPFVHGLTVPPHYVTRDGTAPLHRLSAPSYRAFAAAEAARPFDSGEAGTTWHRLYLEALIPPRCAIRVLLAATDAPAAPVRSEDWHEHAFGSGAPAPGVPKGAWVPAPSEVPFHDGLLGCPVVRDRAGLFTALIQRSNRRVRALRGRFLWVRVELSGDRRTTPEIAALRAYATRFSYVRRYLPELYHEQTFGAEAEEVLEARAPSTAPDFLERFVANVEGVLTMLEDRIASAHVLTDARTVPDASLEWLASWIGATFDPVYPAAARRELLRAAPHLYRNRGTLAGLRDALGIATGGRFEDGRVLGGAVNGGEIVILENWRLRRTFATILGADLADEDDPLLSGLAVSGNSFVGDTLFLGDEQKKEFLALFGADLPASSAEQAAMRAFFDDLAHRVTVLVHQEVEPQDLGLIRRVVELEKPAHVAALVTTARYPFLVGAASLTGVDTYLGPPRERQRVRLDRSTLGQDFLTGIASLDARLASSAAPLARAEPPIAVLRAPAVAPVGESFTLDGSASRAAPGRTLADFHWTLLA